MSTQPFKFRHLDTIVGIFVLGSVGVVVAALLLVGHARQWFTRTSTVTARTSIALPARSISAEDLRARADFLDELAESLRPGTPIELAGQVVGKVEKAAAPGGQLTLTMAVENAALEELYTDATTVIKVPLAPFMGQTRVVLKGGHSGERMWNKDISKTWLDSWEIAIAEPRDSTAMAMSVLKKLDGNLQPMIDRVAGVLDETRGLLAEVRAQRLPERAAGMIDEVRAQHLPERVAALADRVARLMDRADRMAGDAEQLVGGLAAGKGIAGRVLSDEKLAADLAGIAADLRAITAEIRTIAPAAPGLVEGTRGLLDEVHRMVDGLSRHWLLRSYTGPAEPGRLEPSGAVDAPSPTPPAAPAGAAP